MAFTFRDVPAQNLCAPPPKFVYTPSKIRYSGDPVRCGRDMSGFDYTAPAELFAVQGRTGLRYRRFGNAAQAILYAVEKLPANLLLGTRIEVRRHHYDAKQIRALYESEAFPIARKKAPRMADDNP
jgi:hypothetical protein